VSLKTEKLRSAPADVAGREHYNTSKVLMFGKIPESGDAKDFMKVSGKSAQSDCLDHILNHLDTPYLMTSKLAGRHATIQIALGRHP